MELIDENIERLFEQYPLESQDGLDEQRVIVKYFTPWAPYVWYITEGSKKGNDWILFGYVVNGLNEDFNEWGYVSLNELQSVKGPLGLKVERDLHFGEHMIDQEGIII